MVLTVVLSWSQQSAKLLSQPNMDESCRAAQGGSKGDFHSGSDATGGQMSLGSLPEKEMVANPSTAGTAAVAAAG